MKKRKVDSMHQDYLILLPPSEGKAAGGEGVAWKRGTLTFQALDDARRDLVTTLQQALQNGKVQPEKLLGVKGNALNDALSANRSLDEAATLPAIERYTGVMFDHLDYAGMPGWMKQRFDEKVILFSGLWGLLAPRDGIPNYKLKIDATLPPLGRLSSWWRPILSPALNERAAGRVVWDLLPQAHAAGWMPQPDRLAGHITVKFVKEVEKKGEIRHQSVSHWSKALKGALVRFILERKLTDPTTLAEFDHPEGYRFSASGSTLEGRFGCALFVRPLDR